MLDHRISPENLAILDRAGSTYTAQAEKIVLTADRGAFRTEADADLYAMNALATLIARAERFIGRIVAEKVSTRVAGEGIAIVKRRDGRYAVLEFTEYANDGRNYDSPTVLDTEPEARALANGLWEYYGL
jgi:hypothetical protein